MKKYRTQFVECPLPPSESKDDPRQLNAELLSALKRLRDEVNKEYHPLAVKIRAITGEAIAKAEHPSKSTNT
jgi:hypothetical protein